MDWSTNLQMVAAGLAMGSIYALVALGFVLIFNAVNVVNFAQGEFAMVPAFVAVWLMTSLNLPFALTCVITVVFMGIFGIVFQRIAYYPLAQPQLPAGHHQHHRRGHLPEERGTAHLRRRAVVHAAADLRDCVEHLRSVCRPPVHRHHRVHPGPARLPVLLLREDEAGQEDAGHGAGQADGAAAGHPGGER